MAESEAEWRDLFETYRLEVIRAGFGVWDEAAAQAASEAEGIRERFQDYAGNFLKMLGCLNAGTGHDLLRQLGDRISTRDGAPVMEAVIEREGGDVHWIGKGASRPDLVAMFEVLNRMLFGPAAPEKPDPQEGFV